MTRKKVLRNNNIGLGVDVESIERFRRFVATPSHRFIARIYTKREQRYCFSVSHAAARLATSFAGKEAVLKALSLIADAPIRLGYSDIEIRRRVSGAPKVFLPKSFRRLYSLAISLSHSGDNAVAVAVVRT